MKEKRVRYQWQRKRVGREESFFCLMVVEEGDNLRLRAHHQVNSLREMNSASVCSGAGVSHTEGWGQRDGGEEKGHEASSMGDGFSTKRGLSPRRGGRVWAGIRCGGCWSALL